MVDIAPNIAVTLRARCLANVVHAFGLSRFAQEGMEERMSGDLTVLLLWTVRIRPAGNADDDGCCLVAGEPPATLIPRATTPTPKPTRT
jgi:hypothetical protein